MGDSYGYDQKDKTFNDAKENKGGFKGNRSREGGGFRIRLSDNEMRASRSIQEAFNLRSTVAVLGFAIRTIGQMLEEGKLDEVISEHRSKSPQSNSNRNQYDSKNGRNNINENSKINNKPNPFARPSKPESNTIELTEDVDENRVIENPNEGEESNNQEGERNITESSIDPEEKEQESKESDS